MELILNDETLRKCWGSSGEFWFSHKDYSVKSVEELANYERPDGVSQSQYLLSIGLIPFVNVTSEQAMRSFIEKTGNKKLIASFSKVKSEDFTETFWKYFNAYKELSRYDEYETEYVKEKIILWCKENKIEYK